MKGKTPISRIPQLSQSDPQARVVFAGLQNSPQPIPGAPASVTAALKSGSVFVVWSSGRHAVHAPNLDRIASSLLRSEMRFEEAKSEKRLTDSLSRSLGSKKGALIVEKMRGIWIRDFWIALDLSGWTTCGAVAVLERAFHRIAVTR